MLIGQGRIDGRRAVVQGDDFTVRGGAADAAIWQKMVYAERMAHDLRLPLVRLVDGTGGGGSVKSLEDMGFTYVPFVPGFELTVANLSRVPVVAAALGPVAGLGAARVVASHFSVIVRDTRPAVRGGPAGGGRGHGRGARTRRSWAARARRPAPARWTTWPPTRTTPSRRSGGSSPTCPGSAWEAPPCVEASDPADRREEELLSIVPRERRSPYEVRRILELVFDAGSVFELGAAFGRSAVTALARLGGRPVGVIASDPKHYGGGLTADASEKLTRFVDMCDQFHLPLVNFVDQPGFVIGTEAERRGTIRRGTRAMFSVYQASVPAVSVLVRKVFGVAGAAHGDHSRLNLRYAWPSGDWGSLPIEGGIEAAYRRELEAAEDPAALREEIRERLDAVRSPFRTAERFGVEEIIDPRDTRPLLCDWAERAHELVAMEVAGGPRGARPAARRR